MLRLALPIAALFVASQATAQDGGWTYSATLYGWLPGLDITADTPFGSVEGDVSASDAVTELNFAFLGAFEARNGPWGVIGDLLYLDLSTSADTPGPLFDAAEVNPRSTVVNGYLAYRIIDNPRASVDLAAGFRSYRLQNEVVLSADLAPEQSFDSTETWTDPLVAVRFSQDFAENWYATAFLDAGGFGVGSESTWQALGTVGYRYTEHWSMQMGWRYMEANGIGDSEDIDISLSGPVFGVTYRF
jgi:hypothetical protein